MVVLFQEDPLLEEEISTVSPETVEVAMPQVATDPEFMEEDMFPAMVETDPELPSNSSGEEGGPETEVITTPPISSSIPAERGALITTKLPEALEPTPGVPDTTMEVLALVAWEAGPVFRVEGSSHLMSASEEWKADMAVPLAGGQGNLPEVASHPVDIYPP
jgi:hypothetical protein